MNNTIITMMKKELNRFFGDSRMVMTTIILPGLMIFVLYSFMGTALKEQLTSDKFEPKCYFMNLPEEWNEPLKKQGFRIHEMGEDQLDKAKQKVQEQDFELLVQFPENFMQSASGYDIASGEKAPEVQVYYNSASTESTDAYQAITAYLDQYEQSLANQFDVNADEKGKYDLATKKDITADMFSSMVPFLLLIFLYSGCIAVAPESIAGEKEKGTMAALLITPVKRSHIALGKIAALSLIAVLSGASSALGTLLSLPKLMDSDQPGFDQGVYQFSDYALLAAVIISTALVLVTLISLVSAFARTLKEAQTYVTPLMILVMLIGITAMFGDDAKTALGYYCIPVYNSVQSMVGIFAFQSSSVYILTTIAVNLLATGLGAVILAKMFDSEYIMFHK